MAFITVLARRKEVATFQLRGPTSVGRSMDCDIYIPDVFVSRVHCRFVQRDGSWHVVDAESQNGIWCQGKRLGTYLLKPADVIEIGTIAFRYNAGDSDRPSHPAPLGMGLGVTELMDTVYAHEMRPAQFVKAQKVRTAEWRRRVKSRLAEPIVGEEFEPVVDTEPWKREEWAELDMELQIVEGQAQMRDWEPPIFNPKRKALAVGGATAAGPATAGKPGTLEMDSIDEEVEIRFAEHKAAARHPAPQQPAGMNEYDGIEFVAYTWRDRLRDSLSEWLTGASQFSRRNPQLAMAILLGAVVLVGGSVKAWQYWQASAYHAAREYTPAEIRAMNAAN